MVMELIYGGLVASFAWSVADVVRKRLALRRARLGSSCCLMRRKVALAVVVVPFSEHGVSDAEMAEFMRWDQKSPTGKPVIAFRYCPWCGKVRAGEEQLVESASA